MTTETAVDLFGAILHINSALVLDSSEPVVVDVETDEKDNFVGIAITNDGKDVYYYTSLKEFGEVLSYYSFVGHSLKGDMKWLKGWGADIKSSQLYFDTCLASYVVNTTKESHGLKVLAKELLGIEWATYKEMAHPDPEHPKKKITLDKQDVETVARYCASDCLATYRLWKHFNKTMNVQQKRILETIELPTARALLDMELKGAMIDVPYLQQLDSQFKNKLSQLKNDLTVMVARDCGQFQGEFNPNSSRHKAALLKAQGAELPKSRKGNDEVNKSVLEQWSHLPCVPLLQEYSKIKKLESTYTTGLLEQHKEGRIYASFNQITSNQKQEAVGISTNRLSSSNPNLQNIPTRTEEGALIRQAFIAPPEKVLIDADFSQIEPRIVAHFSKDPFLLSVFKEDRDLYEELVKGTGRSRQDGKTFMLALLYGAQPEKLASVFKCSPEEAEDILNKMWKKLPGVTAWLNRVKWEAKTKKGVWTLHKRFIPLPDIDSANRFERMHWERAAVNYVIQGSAAEVMKLALIKLTQERYTPVLTVHDEFLFEENDCGGDYDAEGIQKIMENIVQLDVPLKVEVGVGRTWREAKG